MRDLKIKMMTVKELSLERHMEVSVLTIVILIKNFKKIISIFLKLKNT